MVVVVENLPSGRGSAPEGDLPSILSADEVQKWSARSRSPLNRVFLLETNLEKP